MSLFLRPLLMFLSGFLVWGLTFARSYAFRNAWTSVLCGIIFLDELIGIFLGMWLAREGYWYDAVAAALGGSISAMLIIKVNKEKK